VPEDVFVSARRIRTSDCSKAQDIFSLTIYFLILRRFAVVSLLLTARILRAGIAFRGVDVSLSDCPHKISKTTD